MREIERYRLTWDSEIIYITERKIRMLTWGERRESEGAPERRPLRPAGSLSYFLSPPVFLYSAIHK